MTLLPRVPVPYRAQSLIIKPPLSSTSVPSRLFDAKSSFISIDARSETVHHFIHMPKIICQLHELALRLWYDSAA